MKNYNSKPPKLLFLTQVEELVEERLRLHCFLLRVVSKIIPIIIITPNCFKYILYVFIPGIQGHYLRNTEKLRFLNIEKLIEYQQITEQPMIISTTVKKFDKTSIFVSDKCSK